MAGADISWSKDLIKVPLPVCLQTDKYRDRSEDHTGLIVQECAKTSELISQDKLTQGNLTEMLLMVMKMVHEL